MARPTLKRDWYIPRKSTEIRDEESDAVAYLYQQVNGKWCAVAFCGKRQKPDWHFSFPSEQAARQYIEGHARNRRESLAFKAERRQAQKEFTTTLVVGSVLYTSWGYDQTNVEWFQVTEVYESGKTVKIREIAGEIEDTGFMCGKTTPVKDAFRGEELVKRVQNGDIIRIDDVRSAYKWNGQPKHCSWGH